MRSSSWASGRQRTGRQVAAGLSSGRGRYHACVWGFGEVDANLHAESQVEFVL